VIIQRRIMKKKRTFGVPKKNTFGKNINANTVMSAYKNYARKVGKNFG
jgi:hypothetical protein